ncbi:MAG TPA: hypothetical protein VJR23_04700 [Candidatus Acidoferrales bacterium]|nr:hypothetical protein [Candidatus Acidoferrales bacterium]
MRSTTLPSGAAFCILAAILSAFAPAALSQRAATPNEPDWEKQAFTQSLPLPLRPEIAPPPLNLDLPRQKSLPNAISPAASWKLETTPATHSDRKTFFLLSGAVYGIGFLDMVETNSLRPYLVEHDPLARPFTKLPTPAYYACGAALATGVNFLAWKMMHSRRWHSLWLLPQYATIIGNDWGYASTMGRQSNGAARRLFKHK